MKVFISWSGSLSHRCAQLLSTWLPSVIQAAEPFLSSEDVEKGSKWFDEVTEKLSSSSIGIICLTRDNREKPWILFEAGALSKALGKPRVCPLLINIRESDVTGPLAQFQCTRNSKEEILKLVRTINSQDEHAALKLESLERSFAKWWPDYELASKTILEEESRAQPEPVKREPLELLEEILETCRAIQRNIKPRISMEQLSTLTSPGSGLTITEIMSPAFTDYLHKRDALAGLASSESEKPK